MENKESREIMQKRYIRLMDKLDSIEETIFGEAVDKEDYGDIELDNDKATNDYMVGLWNGIELVQAMLEEREMEFLDRL